jgi:hypothetical protein
LTFFFVFFLIFVFEIHTTHTAFRKVRRSDRETEKNQDVYYQSSKWEGKSGENVRERFDIFFCFFLNIRFRNTHYTLLFEKLEDLREKRNMQKQDEYYQSSERERETGEGKSGEMYIFYESVLYHHI